MNTHDIDMELPPLPTPDADHYDSGTFAPVWKQGKLEGFARAAIEADRQRRGEPVELDRYDPVLLGGQDGMPAYVWHDIIRSELDRAYDFYMDQIDRAVPQPAELKVSTELGG